MRSRKMIDRSLNYGRHIIADFAAKIGHYKTVLDIGAGKGDDVGERGSE